MANKVQIPVIPDNPEWNHDTRTCMWVAPATKARIDEIANASGISLRRITEFIIQLGMNRIELVEGCDCDD